MKKSISAVFAVILMISLAACGTKSGHDAYKEIYKRYNALNSFYAEVEITVRNARSENTYCARQFYKSPDAYSIAVDSPEELGGSGYVMRGGETLVKSGFGKSENLGVCSPSARNVVFITDFFEEYYKSEETSVSTAGGMNEKTTVLSCFVKDGTESRFSRSLWIDNKTFLPVKLETYDINGKPTVTVNYKEFKRNCDIEDKFFE